MMRTLALIVLACGSVASAARAQVELKNDGFVDGGMAAFQAGFVAGEIAAARFDPAGAGPGAHRLTEIRFLFGGGMAGVSRMVGIHVWEDTGPRVPPRPGT